VLRDPIWVSCFAEHATKIAEQAEEQANRAATNNFMAWLSDGPAAGLGRHHKLSRAATGWITSRTGADDDQPDEGAPGDMHDEEVGGLSATQIQQAIAKETANTTPLTAQGTVKLEAKEWGQQWAEDEEYVELE